MMQELSLHILDIAQNSIRAKASFIQILIHAITDIDVLEISIEDNGYGIPKDMLSLVTNPFFTTRKSRGVGLGLSFFKYSAESTGGHFFIESIEGNGTKVTASFSLNHIDRIPLGDITSTMYSLIILNANIDFLYTYHIDNRMFSFDSRELKKILGDISYQEIEVCTFIKEYLTENKIVVDHGVIL